MDRRIRELRWAVVVCIGFTNGEYHIVYVDLIAPRGGGWKETGDFDPLSLSNTSPDPGGVRCGGAFWLPRFMPIQVAVFRCRSIIASSEFCSAICVRAGIARVSVGVLGLDRSFFIIGGKVVCSCGYVGFCFFFRRICADRGWIVCLGW